MFSNTKLLILASFFVIVSGFGFLWFGLQLTSKENTSVGTGPTFEVSPIEVKQATGSAALASHSSSGNVFGTEGERVLVTKVVDGDTIIVNNATTVRFVGVDTPETVDPRRPVGCFGKEASNEVKNLLTGKEIILQKDVSETDKYKRLLRLIFLPLPDGQTLFVNDYLVREGFARVMTYPPDIKYNEQFRQAEADAKKDSRGLWGKCN